MGELCEIPQPGAHPEVIEVLEKALERARAGEIIGVGIVAACNGRADGTSYSLGDGNIASLVCACERLKLRLLGIGHSGDGSPV